MGTHNVLSWSLYPRYQSCNRHLIPVIVEAARRILYDDGTVLLDTITASEYFAAIGTHVPAMRDERKGATA